MQKPADDILATAMVQTVAYVDVFDYPLLPEEIHRYLVGVAAPREAVDRLLGNGALIPHRLQRAGAYITLPGREAISAIRRRREAVATRLWPLALHYGRLISQLPFVRMVAVTGSLAVNNADADADIDYLVVTANDRLWLSRAWTILIVRLAARRGVQLCPNYLLSERALRFREQNLYTAHELAQMVPLSGYGIYQRIRQLNGWMEAWLPNAAGLPATPETPAPADSLQRAQRLLELALRGRLGQRLERWEMERKLLKFGRQMESAATQGALEARFSADWCKGHFDGHAEQIMGAYDERMQRLGVER